MNRRHLLTLLGASAAVAALPRPALAQSPVIVSRIAIVGRWVVIPTSIGGRAPVPFAFDTGAELSLINPGYARELALVSKRTTRFRGIGGVAELPLYLAPDVVLGGGIRQPSVAFAGLDRNLGGGIQGAFAAGLLTALDSDLDIEAGEWRVYPGGRPNRSGFTKLGGGIQGGTGTGSLSPRLYGDAAVNGRRLRFLLDTGAPGSLSLHERAAKTLGLWNDDRPYAPQRTSGIGGKGGMGRLVRLDHIEFGGQRFERPIALLRRDGLGQNEDGIIGLQIIRHFNLSTDVANKALWVQPHGTPALADGYNRAGLWVEEERGRPTVIDVGNGSPAAAAGVRPGDVVVGQRLAEIIRQTSSRAGTPVTLEIERGGQRRTVNFTLADYL
ncbi:hypothetical protein GCM10022280_00260 [Sphingomonas swuensis]|uniref:PDZ domain-containing protein n=1 Tax=Sphingomonas swuensis TaxID=977800 RepID=A0ABP7S829_9SPHN